MADEKKDLLDKFIDSVKITAVLIKNIIIYITLGCIAVAFICWVFKIKANVFLLVGFIFLGLLSVWKLTEKLRPAVKSVALEVVYYLGLVITTICFCFIYFNRTLLYMYGSWGLYGGTLLGFFLIFAPIIGLVAGAVALTTLSKEKKWSKRWLTFCVVACIVGLLAYRFVKPADIWLESKVIALVDRMDSNTINTSNEHGLYVQLIKDALLYDKDPNTPKKNYVFNADPNAIVKKGEILKVDDKHRTPIKDVNSGKLFSNIIVGGKSRFVKTETVRSFTRKDIIKTDEYTILKKSKNEWVVYLYTDAPVQLLSDWQDKIIAIYNLAGGHVPKFNAGDGETTLYYGRWIGPRPGRPLQIQWKKGGIIKLSFCK
ncbi:hypothetical protein ACFL23_01555 [Patescibacteria group bacterium]